MSTKTHVVKAKDLQHNWWIIDASDKILGRLSTKVATIIRGKHKPNYTTNLDNGDMVVVINAEKIALTGNKLDDKRYYWHTGYMGGIKSESAKQALDKHPERVIMDAVSGMLPKNKMRDKFLKHLKVYKGEKHPHLAHKPKPLEI